MLCCGITIRRLLGCPFVPQLMRLSHLLIAANILLSLTDASCVFPEQEYGLFEFLNWSLQYRIIYCIYSNTVSARWQASRK